MKNKKIAYILTIVIIWLLILTFFLFISKSDTIESSDLKNYKYKATWDIWEVEATDF